MKKGFAKKFLEHPDKNEIFSKLMNGINYEEISNWLALKYTDVQSKKLVISAKDLQEFHEGYFDLYEDIKNDILQLKASGGLEHQEELVKSLKNNKTYRQKVNELIDKEIDLKKMIGGSVAAMEARMEQMYDYIQSNPTNFKLDSRMIEWFNSFSTMVEKYDKIVNQSPDKVIQHNVTVQVIDQQIQVFYDVILDVLKEMDYDITLKFMQSFNEKMSAVKPDFVLQENKPVEERIADVKMLKDTLSKRVGETVVVEQE